MTLSIQNLKLKTCTLCQKEKDILLFNKKKRSKDGHQNICRECNSSNGKKHYKENAVKVKKRVRARNLKIISLAHEMVLSYLKKGCIDCGERDIVVLDFDHMHDKTYAISHMVRSAFSLESLELEISKCEVRCANCHRRKTAKDFNWWKVKV